MVPIDALPFEANVGRKRRSVRSALPFKGSTCVVEENQIARRGRHRAFAYCDYGCSAWHVGESNQAVHDEKFPSFLPLERFRAKQRYHAPCWPPLGMSALQSDGYASVGECLYSTEREP